MMLFREVGVHQLAWWGGYGSKRVQNRMMSFMNSPLLNAEHQMIYDVVYYEKYKES